MAHPLDATLAAALPPGTLYAVGGRVRDEFRREIERVDLPAKDFDYVVVGLPAAQVRERLERVGRVGLVGASFAVFKLSVDGQTVDVSLPRRERSTGAGHRDFVVESGPQIPLAEDLGRRDFRMNMIARALPSGEVVDPYGGVGDIRARRIDILTPRAFEEDPLRMLRAAQFAARFRYEPTAATLAAMRAAAGLTATISPERIAEELTKLFERAPAPSAGIELLRETGILAHLWPELLEGYGVEQNEWHAFDVYRHNLRTLDAAPPSDLVLRLAALLHDVGKPRTKDGPHFYRHEIVGAEMARAMLARLRFSNEVVETTERLVRNHMYSVAPDQTDAAVRRFVRRIGRADLRRQFALRHADIAGSGLPKRDDRNERFEARVQAELDRNAPFSLADLQIDGAAVIESMRRRGLVSENFRGDRRVGDALQYLFEQVTDRPERNERTTLQALLEQYLDARAGGVERA